MTTSNAAHNRNKEAYVWIWLPGNTTPVVAGKLEQNGSQYDFFYGQSYLKNQDRLSFSKEDLPLEKAKRFTSKSGLHKIFRDSMPDAWGQRVLTYQHNRADLTPVEMLLLSGTDRIGALHFQRSAEQLQLNAKDNVSLDELYDATQKVESGQPLSSKLAAALQYGTSIGGARPKVTIESEQKKYIAKFSSTTDVLPIVQTEYAAMCLAKRCGIEVASVKLTKAAGKHVLLIERFDRERMKDGWARKFMVSALTQLNLSEDEGRYASYLDLADKIRLICKDPKRDLIQLFDRMVFNILIGNTDDHAKNHAFFWDGEYYQLTPAYDLCPFPRSGQQATQAMQVGKLGNYSLLKNALSASEFFGLNVELAEERVEKLVSDIRRFWPEVCEQAELTKVQQNLYWETAILNPYCFFDEV